LWRAQWRLSALGDWVAIVALGLHIKEATDSGFAVAGLWICLFGPSVAVAGHAGLLVDRIEATRLLAATSLLGAVVAMVLGFTSATAPILMLTGLLGVVFAISQPAEFALVPPLAGAHRIQEANGHIETSRYLGFGVGPLLGGLLFATGGLELAMLVDAATFAAVAGAALALRVQRDPGSFDDAERTPRARDGIAFLFRDRVLSLAMMVAFSSLLFMSAVWVGELFGPCRLLAAESLYASRPLRPPFTAALGNPSPPMKLKAPAREILRGRCRRRTWRSCATPLRHSTAMVLRPRFSTSIRRSSGSAPRSGSRNVSTRGTKGFGGSRRSGPKTSMSSTSIRNSSLTPVIWLSFSSSGEAASKEARFRLSKRSAKSGGCENGKGVHIQVYLAWDQALEAAGLRE
jgi:MFS transporter